VALGIVVLQRLELSLKHKAYGCELLVDCRAKKHLQTIVAEGCERWPSGPHMLTQVPVTVAASDNSVTPAIPPTTACTEGTGSLAPRLQ
jgi:hypothetical protein